MASVSIKLVVPCKITAGFKIHVRFNYLFSRRTAIIAADTTPIITTIAPKAMTATLKSTDCVKSVVWCAVDEIKYNVLINN